MVWTLLEMLNFALRALVEEVDGRRQVAHRRVSCDRLAWLLRTLLTFKRSTLVHLRSPRAAVVACAPRRARGGRGLKVERRKTMKRLQLLSSKYVTKFQSVGVVTR